MIERTFVMIKPDGVARGLIGKCMQKFEDCGLKVIGLKMVKPTKEFTMKHYTDDIAQRRGEKVRELLVNFISENAVCAMCIEGINAIEVVRKMVGGTEPKTATPGTIRGDFSHHAYNYCDENSIAVANVVHASGDKKDAEYEVPLWFKDEELVSFFRADEKFTYK